MTKTTVEAIRSRLKAADSGSVYKEEPAWASLARAEGWRPPERPIGLHWRRSSTGWHTHYYEDSEYGYGFAERSREGKGYTGHTPQLQAKYRTLREAKAAVEAAILKQFKRAPGSTSRRRS